MLHMCQNYTICVRTIANLQRYSTDTNGIILAHMQHLMGAVFCVWCGICAKYLAFGIYPTATVGALSPGYSNIVTFFSFFFLKKIVTQ